MSFITDLINFLRQFEGTIERPSPPDIAPESSITIVDHNMVVDYSRLNIPFTKPPKVLKYGMLDTDSMDGFMDIGHNVIYLEPVDKANHQIMVDWIAEQWLSSKGMLATDCVYRMMQSDEHDPYDFTKYHKPHGYAIHRVNKVASDNKGRYFEFKGINNPSSDPYKVRDKNILWINGAIIP